jgi:hypothetical protein
MKKQYHEIQPAKVFNTVKKYVKYMKPKLPTEVDIMNLPKPTLKIKRFKSYFLT